MDKNDKDDALFEEKDHLICKVHLKALEKLFNIADQKDLSCLKRFESIFFDNANKWWCQLYEPNSDLGILLKKSWFYRITYILRKSIFISSATAFHFQNVLQSYSKELNRLLQRRTVKIVSVGCGSASDVVAVVMVLESIAKCRNVELDFRVTVVNADEKWKVACIFVLSSLEQFEGAIRKIAFIEADLSKSLMPNTLQALRDADIITMFDYETDFLLNGVESKKAIENITKTLSAEALLFALSHKEYLGGHNGYIDNFNLIYEECKDYYVLDLNVIENLCQYFQRNFEYIHFLYNKELSVRVWKKISKDSAENIKDNATHPVGLENREKFDIMRDYFQFNVWSTWERRFSEKKNKSFWNQRRIIEILEKRKQIRDIFISQYTLAKKSYKLARQEMLKTVNVQSPKSKTQENEQYVNLVWEKYIEAKNKVNFVKIEVCYHFYRNLCEIEGYRKM